MLTAQQLAALPEQKRLQIIASLKPEQLQALKYDWAHWAREKQLPPDGDWRLWLLLTGRGWGKTRVGAEFIRARSKSHKFITVCGPTAADARDVMVEGESGILAICPKDERPLFEPTKRRLTFPSGARCEILSADEPDRIRGRQSELLWLDELCAWRYPEAFDMLMFGFRLGRDPRCIITTTPKPTPLIRNLVNRSSKVLPDGRENPGYDGTVVLTKGSTYENLANLSGPFRQHIISQYEGTRLGRQELHAEILDDLEGALWRRKQIEDLTVPTASLPGLRRIVVGVDPSGGVAETGVIVVGLGVDGIAYVIDDCSTDGSPDIWAKAVNDAYHVYEADRVIAEKNQGGAMVESTLRAVNANLSLKLVMAAKGKQARAEPVAALYEQRKVRHVGEFPRLTDQMVQWAPDTGAPSPDRLDALVWALTELMLERVIGPVEGPPVLMTRRRRYS